MGLFFKQIGVSQYLFHVIYHDHDIAVRVAMRSLLSSFPQSCDARIFNMTEFKKIIYFDTDTIALKNMDHLALEPSFTTAFTHSCCNRNDPVSPELFAAPPQIEYVCTFCIISFYFHCSL